MKNNDKNSVVDTLFKTQNLVKFCVLKKCAIKYSIAHV